MRLSGGETLTVQEQETYAALLRQMQEMENDESDAKTSAADPLPLNQIHYYELIETSELTGEAKAKARQALTAVLQEVRDGKIVGYRMKIRGIHSEPFGGQEGGRKMHLERDGFTIIRLMGNKMKRDVIETPVESVKGCKHPAIYPTAVVAEFLRLLTRPGDVVIDPFMGSGSTALACLQLGRRYLGCDINPAYCAEARTRIAQSDCPGASMPLVGDGVFSGVTI